MCLILFAWKAHPDYRLILAANRDEFYDRPARKAGWWEEHPDLLAGKDLQAGGTWMGVTRKGKFAAITNYRQLPFTATYETSRGNLVKDYLVEDLSPKSYFAYLKENGSKYEGFNLLFGDADELYYYSNRGERNGLVPEGVYGLSNHLLDTPWPKVRRGKAAFEKALDGNEQSTGQYIELLRDKKIAPDEELPETGIGIQKERWLSAMFIESPGYGTRSSTALMIGRNNRARFEERGWDPPSVTVEEFIALPD